MDKSFLECDKDLFYLFKINGKFSPVSTMCSNNKQIVVFRKNKTVNIVDVESEKIVHTFFLRVLIEESYFLTNSTVVCKSSSNELYKLKLVTANNQEILLVKIKDCNKNHLTATKLISISNEFTLGNSLIFAEDKKLIQLSREEITCPILRFRSIISYFTKISSFLFIGLENKEFKFYNFIKDSYTLVSEFVFPGQVTSVSLINKEGLAVISLTSGSLYLVDYNKGITLDEISVRDSKILSIVIGDIVYSGGVDSRIILHRVSTKFVKLCQNTFHCSEITGLIKINGVCWSAGEDSILVRNWYESEKVSGSKIYENVIFSNTFSTAEREYFYTVDKEALNIHYYEDSPPVSTPEKTNEKSILIKRVHRHFTPNTPVHYLNFKINSTFLSTALISQNGRYFVYGTEGTIFVYKITTEPDLDIELLKEFKECAVCCDFTNFEEKDFLIYSTGSKLTIFNLTDFKTHSQTVIEFKYGSFIISNNSFVFLGGINRLYSLNSKGLKTVATFKEKKFVSGEFTSTQLTLLESNACKKFIVSLPDLTTKEENVKCNTALGNFPIKILNDKYIITHKNVILVDTGAVYNLQPLIYQICIYKNKPLIIQSSWEFIKRQFHSKKFQEKFSNK